MGMVKRKELLFILTLVLVSVILRVFFFFYTEDDAFITFRYVKNFLDGKGFVYNLGENVLGITNSLYAFILILFGKWELNFILFGKIINVLSEGLSILLIGIIVRKWGQSKIWILSVFLFVISPPNIGWCASGMETSFYILFLLLSFYLYLERRFILLGISSGILFLIRPDGGQLLFVLFFDYLIFDIFKPILSGKENYSKKILDLWREHKSALASVVVFCIVVLPWLIFCYSKYGSFLPNSIRAKFITYPGTPEGSNFFDSILYFLSPGPRLILTIFFVIGFIGILDNKCYRVSGVYFLFSLLLMAISRVHLFSWYFAPLLPFYYIIASRGMELYLEKASSLNKFRDRELLLHRIFLSVFIFILLALSVYSTWRLYKNLKSHSEGLEACHKNIGLWIKDNTPTNSIICVGDIGYIGYYSERKIIDFMGLVSPEVLPFWKKGMPGEIIKEFKPDYFVVGQYDYFFQIVKDNDWFNRNYKMEKKFGGRNNIYYVFIRKNNYPNPAIRSVNS